MRSLKQFTAVLAFSLTVLGDHESRAQGAADLLYPEQSVNRNIDHLESALDGLIEKFGTTLDRSTLKAIQHLMGVVGSAKLAMSDVADDALDDLSKERRIVIYEIAEMITRFDRIAYESVDEFSNIEQRFSNTLYDVMRAERTPLVLDIEPPIIRKELDGPVNLKITGSNLGHEENRLIVGDVELKPVVRLPGELSFRVDRAVFFEADLRTSLDLKLYKQGDDGFWPFWGLDELPPLKFELRSVGERIGSYKIDVEVKQESAPKTLSRSFSNNSDIPKDLCILASEWGAESKFDIGYTKSNIKSYKITHDGTATIQSGLRPTVYAHWLPPIGENKPPASAVEIIVNTPEKVCIRYKAAKDPKAPVFKANGWKSSISGELTFRVVTADSIKRLSLNGEIEWGGDHPVTLPENTVNFVVQVTFVDEEKPRVLRPPISYGSIRVSYDPDSRTLVFRPDNIE